jgi:hypothetical protein
MEMENLNTQKLGIEVLQNSQKKFACGLGFWFSTCEVCGLAIIHTRNEPNLATGQRGK